MQVKKYKLLTEHDGHAADSIVYDCHYADYGCANDDTRMFKEKYVSVTNNADGSYPFFTVPLRLLAPLVA